VEEWSIVDVARMSSVTARTLRHYDAIGLLPPARVDGSGRRYYRRPELLRLQQILLLRGLGLGLPAIAAALAGPGETLPALHEHRERLVADRRRVERLIRTVTETIESLEEGTTMDVEAMFAGFEDDPYEAEARERFGDEAVDESYRRLRGMSAQQTARAATGYPRVHTALAALMAEGVPVDDPRVQDRIGEHYEITSLFWTPDADAYRGLGRMYVEDERFRQNIGGGDDDLVAYLRDAMEVYADSRLA
jgi:DNA-binding transcriptional MerR regulator